MDPWENTDFDKIAESGLEKLRIAFCAFVYWYYRKEDMKTETDLKFYVREIPFFVDMLYYFDVHEKEIDRDIFKKEHLWLEHIFRDEDETEDLWLEDIFRDENETFYYVMKKLLEETDLIVPKHKVSEAVLDQLWQGVLEVRKEEPLHSYFLGLAYMTGAGVPKREDLVIGLVLKAADGGLFSAAGTASYMYEEGIVVEKNPGNAFSLRKCQHQGIEQFYRGLKKPQKSVLEELFWQTVNLGDMSLSRNQKEEAIAFYEKAVAYLCEYDRFDYEESVIRCKCLANLKIGNVYGMKREFETAITYFEKTIAHAQVAIEEIDKPYDAMRYASIGYEYIGDVYHDELRYKEADFNYRQCYEYRDKLNDELDQTLLQEEYVEIIKKRADLLKRIKEKEEAVELYRKALPFYRGLGDSEKYREQYGQCLLALYELTGDIHYADMANNIFEKLAKEFPNIYRYKRMLRKLANVLS